MVVAREVSRASGRAVWRSPMASSWLAAALLPLTPQATCLLLFTAAFPARAHVRAGTRPPGAVQVPARRFVLCCFCRCRPVARCENFFALAAASPRGLGRSAGLSRAPLI